MRRALVKVRAGRSIPERVTGESCSPGDEHPVIPYSAAQLRCRSVDAIAARSVR
jgi:hypothetical protein